MTLSECACVKPFQSPLWALGHNTPSLLTTAASGAAVNKLGHYYTRLTLRTSASACQPVSECECYFYTQQKKDFLPLFHQCWCAAVNSSSGWVFYFFFGRVFEVDTGAGRRPLQAGVMAAP